MPEIGAPINRIQQELKNVQIRSKGRDARKLTDSQIIEQATGKKVDDGSNPVVARQARNKIGKDEFLKMLTHQMQNQDPLNPMDQNKFAADLAQFSQLEQLTNMNSKFDSLKENSKMERKFFAANFVGKTVVTNGNSIELKADGDPANIHFNLEQNAKNVIVRILDSKNNVANEMKLEDLPKGAQVTKWNGKALDGFDSPKGEYRVVVKAWDEAFREIPTKTSHEGVVKSVFFDGDEPLLDLGNRKIALRDVTSFHMTSPSQKKTPVEGVKEFTKNAKPNEKVIQ